MIRERRLPAFETGAWRHSRRSSMFLLFGFIAFWRAEVNATDTIPQAALGSDLAIANPAALPPFAPISGRNQVVETISDVLVDRGDNEVLRRLSGNAAARFSETGISGLATRGASDEKIAVNMANRSDVPPRIFRHLLNQATNAVRNSLLSGASSQQHQIISQVLDEVCQEIGRPRAHEITAEVRRGVYEAFEKGKLNESTVLEFARSDMLAEVAVSLAVLTSISIEIVEQQVLSGRMSGLLLLCKAKDFKWPTAKMIISVASERSASELEQARQKYLHYLSRPLCERCASSAPRVPLLGNCPTET